MKICGIDPGLNGAAVIYQRDCGDLFGADNELIIDAITLPTIGTEKTSREIDDLKFSKWLKAHSPDRAIIENVWSMPKEGVSAAFRFGRAVGTLRSCVRLTGIPLDQVVPVVWKRHFGLIKADKERSRQFAINRMPSEAHWFERKKDHQRAEALLLAIWYAEKLMRERGLGDAEAATSKTAQGERPHPASGRMVS